MMQNICDDILLKASKFKSNKKRYFIFLGDSAFANIDFLGNGTSGSHFVMIDFGFSNVYGRFSAIRFWMEYRHRDSFFVVDILVTRKN